MVKENFGEFVHNLRVKNNLTLTKLAAALDIDQSTLSKIENCKRNFPEEILPKLSAIFRLDIKELEQEFYSQKIAEIIYKKDNVDNLLKLVADKVKYLQENKVEQGQFNLKL